MCGFAVVLISDQAVTRLSWHHQEQARAFCCRSCGTSSSFTCGGGCFFFGDGILQPRHPLCCASAFLHTCPTFACHVCFIVRIYPRCDPALFVGGGGGGGRVLASPDPCWRGGLRCRRVMHRPVRASRDMPRRPTSHALCSRTSSLAPAGCLLATALSVVDAAGEEPSGEASGEASGPGGQAEGLTDDSDA